MVLVSALAALLVLLGFTVDHVGRITVVALLVGAMATASLGLAFAIHRRVVAQDR